MRKLAIWLLLIFVWLSGFMTSKCFASDYTGNWDDVAVLQTNADVIKAIEGMEVSGRVEPKSSVKDVTPKTDCEQGGMVDGVGHQEVKVCLDSAPALKDVEVEMGGKLVRWKGNPNVGYYKLREDGSIDSSHWRSHLPKTGVSA